MNFLRITCVYVYLSSALQNKNWQPSQPDTQTVVFNYICCLKKPGLLNGQPTVHSLGCAARLLARQLAMSSSITRTQTWM